MSKNCAFDTTKLSSSRYDGPITSLGTNYLFSSSLAIDKVMVDSHWFFGEVIWCL